MISDRKSLQVLFFNSLRFGGLYIIATNHDLSILINYAIKSGLYINGVGTIETYQLKAFYCHINSLKSVSPIFSPIGIFQGLTWHSSNN